MSLLAMNQIQATTRRVDEALRSVQRDWIPAFAGMTDDDGNE